MFKTKNNKKRVPLTRSQREIVLKKTEGHCHVCGCKIEKGWAADHVVPHATGGGCDLENFLPCCYECNRLRWFYDPETLKKILRLGVYCNKEMQKKTSLGKQIETFFNEKLARNKRRKKSIQLK